MLPIWRSQASCQNVSFMCPCTEKKYEENTPISVALWCSCTPILTSVMNCKAHIFSWWNISIIYSCKIKVDFILNLHQLDVNSRLLLCVNYHTYYINPNEHYKWFDVTWKKSLSINHLIFSSSSDYGLTHTSYQ